MKDRMRSILGFLGLVEDEYGEYTPSASSRPFSNADGTDEQGYSAQPAPSMQRPFPTTPSGVRVARTPNAPVRGPQLSMIDAPQQGLRVQPLPASHSRGFQPLSQEREVSIFKTNDYNEFGKITDMLRGNRSVVIDLRENDSVMQRRILDFTTGTAYALQATIERLEGGSVYLVSPRGVHVSLDVKDRLRAANFRAFSL
jgi:FtsZ-interacting cell division protein YlmF